MKQPTPVNIVPIGVIHAKHLRKYYGIWKAWIQAKTPPNNIELPNLGFRAYLFSDGSVAGNPWK